MDATSRLETELELLNAMYPEQTSYNAQSHDFKFADAAATLELRLPETYPDSGHPDVTSATNASKADIRTQTKRAIRELNLVDGEEALDAIIAAFQQVVSDTTSSTQSTTHTLENHDDNNKNDTTNNTPKTVIIWLHHLLNTNKRKLALSPPSPSVAGITKPGYPGVLVYSGPAPYVSEHVNTLKAQNWQAFQVRYEEAELWGFGHGSGVKEVESMSDVVKDVESGAAAMGKELGRKRKEEFLKAVGIK